MPSNSPPPGLEHLKYSRSLIPDSIWSGPQLSIKPPKINKLVNISLEGLPSPQLTRVLDILKEVGYNVYNRESRWTQLFQEKSDTFIYPYLLNQMLQNVQQTSYDPMGFQIHYNLYGILPITLEWLHRHKKLTLQQMTNLQASALNLIRPPDYIIYLYLPPNKLTNTKPLTPTQLESFYGEYEWILDNSHAPYPVFKVNLLDSPEHVVETILTIFNQIIERIELDLSETTT